MSATATAPQTPPIIEELEAERQQATTAQREAEAKERDAARPHIYAYGETCKTSPELDRYIQKHSVTKQAWVFNLESIAANVQHFEICGQTEIESAAVAELLEERQDVAQRLDNATAAFNKSNATFSPDCIDEERVDEHCETELLMKRLAYRKQFLTACIKEGQSEILKLKRAADEIVVLIDPTSKLAPPMNFAIAGGPKQSIKSPFERAESIKLREDKVSKAKREIAERETKIANHRARLAELTEELATAQATFGEDRAVEIEKIKTRIEFCVQKIREKSVELDKWRTVAAEESRRLELEKSA